jgi:P-type Ca2+ transporter type 2C
MADQKQPSSQWHTKSSEVVLDELATSRSGLTTDEHHTRLQKYGPNSLPTQKTDTLLTIFISQFKSPLIYLLMAAAALMVVVDEIKDAYIIAAVLLFNAIAGTIQAGRAQNTLKALQKMTKTTATVVRDGVESVIDDSELVPGDIITLVEGDKVPAGARLIETKNLRIDESALTGESQPISKHTDVLDNPNLQISEQRNMIFKGTFVVGGSGTAIVTATGIHTVMGKISQQILTIDTEIPLQKQIAHLSHIIIYVVLILSILIFTVGVLTGKELEVMFTLAVAVIVSAVPEGLPIVLTLLLASGVWRMSKRNVLVKRLQAVEALGEAKIIAVDKTGTITKNELSLTTVYLGGKTYTISGVGYDPKGIISENNTPLTDTPIALHWLGTVANLCSSATIHHENDSYQIHGDPTEAAMTVFAQKLGITNNITQSNFSILDEIPFDSSLRFHALKVQEQEKPPQFIIAGAAEQLLSLSKYIHWEGTVIPLTDDLRGQVSKIIAKMSSDALRVIALAERPNASFPLTPDTVSDITLIGLIGMQDGLRNEVPEALRRTNEAGIKVVMITGDHKDTARAIATKAGIYHDGDTILTNDDIESMTEDELITALGTTTVFARITPEHKLTIVQLFRKRGDIVAMTGDGVNDALSLVAADLGVAMGKRGTEVAKEAADLVLLDDNFGSIVSAVEEGRGIYANLKKVLLFLFSTSLGEVIIIIVAILLFLPAPVLAAQLIWINLVTDGFLDIALAMEPKEKGLLKGKFRKPNALFFDSLMLQRLVIMASVMAIVTLGLFIYYLQIASLSVAMTVAVTSMVVCQWFKAWTCRSDKGSITSIRFFGNGYIVGATTLVIGLHIFAIYTPFMQQLLTLTPLAVQDWILIIALGSLTMVADEVRKWIYRRFEASKIITT